MLQFAQLLANKCLQNFGEKLYIFKNNKRNCLVDKIVMWGHSLGTSIAVTEGEHLTFCSTRRFFKKVRFPLEDFKND